MTKTDETKRVVLVTGSTSRIGVSAICEYLEGIEGAVSFADLVKRLGLPGVAVLIGVLLGGFRVEQRGGFYGGGVYIEI